MIDSKQTVRALALASLAAMTACGGGGGGSSAKVLDSVAARFGEKVAADSVPQSTISVSSPSVVIVNAPTSVVKGAATNLSLQFDSVNPMLAMFAKVAGDDETFRFDLGGSGTKIQTPFNFDLSIANDFPGNQLCFDFAGQDVAALVSADTRQCITIADAAVPNNSPVAGTFAPATAAPGTIVELVAVSADADGDPLSSQWVQLSGPAVTLTGADTATVRFTTPASSSRAVIQLQYIVTDPAGAFDTAEAFITVDVPNRAPVVSAGADRRVTAGQNVQLAGSVSDPDGAAPPSQWVQLSGPQVTLSDPAATNPSFTAPQVTQNTALSFELSATDSAGASSSDQVVIIVAPSVTPSVTPTPSGTATPTPVPTATPTPAPTATPTPTPEPTAPPPPDADADGVPDAQDNCPAAANPNQEDRNSNNVGDACDDPDGDGVVDAEDNCPDVANPDQLDADGNGVGNACEDQTLVWPIGGNFNNGDYTIALYPDADPTAGPSRDFMGGILAVDGADNTVVYSGGYRKMFGNPVPVFAPADGIVVEVVSGNPVGVDSCNSSVANGVSIQHDSGLASFFLSLQPNVLVNVGDRVTPDTQLGTIGNSGCQEEPLLNWLVQDDQANPVDPFAEDLFAQTPRIPPNYNATFRVIDFIVASEVTLEGETGEQINTTDFEAARRALTKTVEPNPQTVCVGSNGSFVAGILGSSTPNTGENFHVTVTSLTSPESFSPPMVSNTSATRRVHYYVLYQPTHTGAWRADLVAGGSPVSSVFFDVQNCNP